MKHAYRLALMVFLAAAGTAVLYGTQPALLASETLELNSSTSDKAYDDKAQMLPKYARSGNIEAVAALLEQGVKPDVIDKIGETALLRAVTGGHTDIVKLLLQHNANVNYVNMNETFVVGSALHNSATLKTPQIAEVLLKNGADINIRDHSGNTPLHWISDTPYWSRPTLDFFLNNGADVNARNDWQQTPMLASYRESERYFELLSILLENGADINAQDIYGRTLLHRAVFEQDLDEIIFLIDKGAQPDLSDTGGHYPIDYAQKHRLSEIVEVLNKAGSKSADQNKLIQMALDQIQLPNMCGGLYAIEFTPDKKQLATLDASGNIFFWNNSTGNLEDFIIEAPNYSHTDWQGNIAFSPDGALVASFIMANDYKSIRVWNRSSKKSLFSDFDNTICFAPKSNFFVSYSGQIRALNNFVGEDERQPGAPDHQIANDCSWWQLSRAIHPDEKLMAQACKNSLQFYTLPDLALNKGDKWSKALEIGKHIDSIKFSQCGQYLYILAVLANPDYTRDAWDGEKSLYIVEADSSISEPVFVTNTPGKKSWIRTWAVSADNSYVAAGGVNGQMASWNLKDKSLIKAWRGHKGHVRALIFDSDNSTIIAASDTGHDEYTAPAELIKWSVDGKELFRYNTIP